MMDPAVDPFDASRLTSQPSSSADATSDAVSQTMEPVAHVPLTHPSPLGVPVPLSTYSHIYPPIGAELDLAIHQRNSSGGTTDSVVTPSVGYASIARSSPAKEPYISSPAAYFHHPPPYSSPGQTMYTQYGQNHMPSPPHMNVPMPPPHMPFGPPPPPGDVMYPTFGAALQSFSQPDVGTFFSPPPFPLPPLQSACPYQQPPSANHSQLHNYEAMKKALDSVPQSSNQPSNPRRMAHSEIQKQNQNQNQPPRRNRQSPAGPSKSSPRVGLSGYNMQHTPAQHTGPRDFKVQPGSIPRSPMHFGGPLGTPAGPSMPSPMPQQTPFIPMNGLGMQLQEYQMNIPISPVPIMSPSMNPNTMTGNYGPAAAAAAAAAANNIVGRTVYVGNLPSDASVDELLNLVRFGPIEEVKIYAERPSVFISFLDGSTAAAFHADASVKGIALHGQQLRIGWGKASYVPKWIERAVYERAATRNVYLGNLPPQFNEQDLRDTCQQYGPIDQVKVVRDKNCGFVHFLSIATAMKAIKQISKLPEWENRKIGFGKDRCAYVPKAQKGAVAEAQAQANMALAAQHWRSMGSPMIPPFSPMTPGFVGFGSPQSGFGSPMLPGAFGQADPNYGNRNVYLGNVHPDTTYEELLNHIRGGPVCQIRIIRDKGIAFVTFADHYVALNFKEQVNNGPGLTVNQRRLKANWGQYAGQLNETQRAQIQHGASRNVYIGLGVGHEQFTEERLRADFAKYGEIEMVNFRTNPDTDKRAAFVNFTTLVAAQRAVERICQDNTAYQGMRVWFGKDRCANVPRHTNGQSTRSSPSAPQHGGRSADGSNASSEHANGSAGPKPSSSSALNEEEYTTGRQPTEYDLDEASIAAADADDGFLDDLDDLEDGQIHDAVHQRPAGGLNGAKQLLNDEAAQVDDVKASVAPPSAMPPSAVPDQVRSRTAEEELYDLEDADEPLRFE